MGLTNISLGVLVAVVWGFNFVVADDAVADVPPLLLVALRYVVVAVAFLPFTRRGGLPWRFIAAVGLLYGVVQFSGLFLGLHLGVSAGVAATVIQAQAIFTIVLARLLLKETFSALQWGGLLVGGAGLALIASSGGGAAPLGGVLFVLGGALGWAASNIVLKKAGKISAWAMTVWQSVAVIPPMLLLSGLIETGQRHTLATIPVKTVAAVGYIALLATGLGNYLWYRLIQRAGPSRAAPFSLLVPVVGVLSGWLVLGERLSTQQVAGVVVSLLGLTGIALAPRIKTVTARRAEQAVLGADEPPTDRPPSAAEGQVLQQPTSTLHYEELEPDTLRARLQDAGYVYITGIPSGFHHAAFLSSALGRLVPQYDGQEVWSIKADERFEGVYHSLNTKALTPHTECYELEDVPPKYLALWCVTPGVDDGGQTTLGDGYAFLDTLTGDERERLADRRYDFVSSAGLQEMKLGRAARHPLLERRAGKPAIIRFTYRCIEYEDDAFLDDIRERLMKFFDDNCVAVTFEHNALLIWDNHRMLHSRTAYRDTRRHLSRVWIAE